LPFKVERSRGGGDRVFGDYPFQIDEHPILLQTDALNKMKIKLEKQKYLGIRILRIPVLQCYFFFLVFALAAFGSLVFFFVAAGFGSGAFFFFVVGFFFAIRSSPDCSLFKGS
jgi:hypothetical protein